MPVEPSFFERLTKGDSQKESPADVFQKYLEKLDPSGEKLLPGAEHFSESCDIFHKAKDDFFRQIQSTPLIYVIWVWSSRCLENTSFGHTLLRGMRDLLDENIISYKRDNGDFTTLGDFKHFDHGSIIDAIRCKRKWHIAKREVNVLNFIDFTDWLAKITFGLIPKAVDRDRLMISDRVLHYGAFIDFISELDDRYQTVANLLYFGGDLTLDEVIKVKIEDIDFEKGVVKFGSRPVHYPHHLIMDLRSQIEDRNSGLVFIGRQNAPLNPATIFRNFKVAALKAGFGSDFSSKDLGKSEIV